MSERYDVAIIGASADGLAAAAMLAGTGLRTIVFERNVQPGGRLVTRQFHPGYYASPFTDDIAPIPDDLFWSLDLAHHGALLSPASAASAIWPDRTSSHQSQAAARLVADSNRRRAHALAHARLVESPPPRRWKFFSRHARNAWPPESWTHRSLAELVCEQLTDGNEAALLAAGALAGRAADPLSIGSALHLLAPGFGGGGVWRGGLGGLGAALAAGARSAGAEISCGLDVTDIRCTKGRAAALALADGTEVGARAVISTLDLKRTFLTLFAWSELPKPALNLIGNFRIAGSTARILLALGAPPKPSAKDLPPAFLRGPVHVMPNFQRMAAAHAAWRSGVIGEHLPMMLRVDSSVDPGLAPIGAAVMTVTVGCVPHTLFDGAWTHDKRDLLGNRVLAAIEEVLPGIAALVAGAELITPPDIEEALGATAGDLWGGEIAPDQMFGFRPGQERKSPYTPVEGLYLAGPSSSAAPFATCAAGAIAADAIIADIGAGKLT